MLVKNCLTGEKIEKSTAYVVKGANGRNLFFSSPSEHEEYVSKKNAKKDIYELYMNVLTDIMPRFSGKTLTIVRRHVKDWSEMYESKYVMFIIDKVKQLMYNTSNTEFFNNDTHYLYLYKIVDNHLQKHYQSYLECKERHNRVQAEAKLKDIVSFDLSQIQRPVVAVNIDKFL